MRYILLLCILFGAQFCSAQNITVTIDKDQPAGQPIPTGMDLETYLIQNLIDYKIDNQSAHNYWVERIGKTTVKGFTLKEQFEKTVNSQAIVIYYGSKILLRSLMSNTQ